MINRTILLEKMQQFGIDWINSVGFLDNGEISHVLNIVEKESTMPKIIITQKNPEPAKEGNWYQGDVKIEYDPVELIDVLSIMDELEEKYNDPDNRWWELRARMAGQKYAQQSVHLTKSRR